MKIVPTKTMKVAHPVASKGVTLLVKDVEIEVDSALGQRCLSNGYAKKHQEKQIESSEVVQIAAENTENERETKVTKKAPVRKRRRKVT